MSRKKRKEKKQAQILTNSQDASVSAGTENGICGGRIQCDTSGCGFPVWVMRVHVNSVQVFKFSCRQWNELEPPHTYARISPFFFQHYKLNISDFCFGGVGFNIMCSLLVRRVYSLKLPQPESLQTRDELMPSHWFRRVFSVFFSSVESLFPPHMALMIRLALKLPFWLYF